MYLLPLIMMLKTYDIIVCNFITGISFFYLFEFQFNKNILVLKAFNVIMYVLILIVAVIKIIYNMNIDQTEIYNLA